MRIVKVGSPSIALIVKALQEGYDTSPKIADHTGISVLNVMMSLRRMCRDKIVLRAGKFSTGKGGNPPTKWALNGEPYIKKYTALYCENDHLYCVAVVDIMQYDPLKKEYVEFSRDQGKIGEKFQCNICQGKIRLP